MSLSRFVLAPVVALLVAAPTAAAAQSASPATLKLSAAGKRALKPSKLTLSGGKLAVRQTSVASSATLTLDGSLRFRSGKRSVRATSLVLTVGRTRSYVSARLGKRHLRLLTVTPTRPATLDAARTAVTLTGARVALTNAAAKRLRTTLKLKRTPATKTLGKLSVRVAPTAPAPEPAPAPAPNPLPAPAPIATATPEPTATATPTPEPGVACTDRFVRTPSNTLDWFSCDLPGAGDLKRWTDYIQSAFPQIPCPGGQGTVSTSGGAARIVADSAYDHRFSVASAELRPDGSATIVSTGSVTYRMPVHGIEESIGAFRIEIAVGGLSGTVYADGAYKERDMSGNVCTAPTSPFSAQPVLTLDLAGITPVTVDGVRRWVHVPARIAAGYEALLSGGTYPAGSAWGSFTIAVPAE